jgi:isopenicillin N synthase-like dioxygenase
MNVPILEGGAIGHASPPASLDGELLAACAEHGCFYLADPLEGSPLARRVLDAARTFFALPLDQKQAVGIARSAHYRGYSAMKGPRDHREQMHLGRESAASSKSAQAFRRLEGPN